MVRYARFPRSYKKAGPKTYTCQNGADGGTGVYMREGTTSRVTENDMPNGEFYDFYSVSPEIFGYHLV
jgi:hypothetical protein